MPFFITNVYHQSNTCNSYSWVKKVMAITPPSLWAFQVVQIYQLSTMTNWISFVTLLHNKRHATALRDNLWTRKRCQQPRTSTRNDVIPSVDASKVYFVASLLTQYLLACKLTCTTRNFDRHQSVTDITAAIGTPWLHTLCLALCLLPVGLPLQRLYFLQWTGDCVCGHLLSSNLTLDFRWTCHVVVTTMLYLLHDLFRVKYLIWNQVCTCVHMHTEDRKHLWLFIVAALRWRHDFPSTIFCIHNVTCSRQIILFHEQLPSKISSFPKSVMPFN